MTDNKYSIVGFKDGLSYEDKTVDIRSLEYGVYRNQDLKSEEPPIEETKAV